MGAQCAGQQMSPGQSHFIVPGSGVPISMHTIQRFGWKPDLPDFRDHIMKLPELLKGEQLKLANVVDNRIVDSKFPIYKQGDLGSCTANAICAAVHYDLVRDGQAEFFPSRLFVYYCERALEGSIDQDSGSALRTGMKVVNKIGVCQEGCWSYDDGQTKFKVRPSNECFDQARAHRSTRYMRVRQDLDELKRVLSMGAVFVFGFTVYESFNMAEYSKGRMVMPRPGDNTIGAHAVLCMGYNDDEKVFICRNSWGKEWGDGGHFYMPYKYILDSWLCRDFWVLLKMNVGEPREDPEDCNCFGPREV